MYIRCKMDRASIGDEQQINFFVVFCMQKRRGNVIECRTEKINESSRK